jgi:dihydroorotate dehydrogenase
MRLDPERAHHLTLQLLECGYRLGLLTPLKYVTPPLKVMGLDFANPVGLAAGMDKDAKHLDALGALGFGFVEVGTVTPKPQPGNPRQRLFRLKDSEAIINRMGFNNEGVDALCRRISNARYKGVIGVNIGKNAQTPLEQAHEDYLFCLKRVYPLADYVAVNISSPNTQNLRQLQEGDALKRLLDELVNAREQLQTQHRRYVPMAVKIAPDLEREDVFFIAELLQRYKIDGVIATNTTMDRRWVQGQKYASEQGGLSGAPVRSQSTVVVRWLAEALKGTLPIIGVGGISSARDAAEKRSAGATLVQVYTGLIYRGPRLVEEILQYFSMKESPDTALWRDPFGSQGSTQGSNTGQ